MASAVDEPKLKTLTGLLAAACAVVPCVFWTRTEEVFALPKLAALWAILALIVAVSAWLIASKPRTSLRVRPSLGDVAAASFVVVNVVAWAFSSDREQSLYGERLQLRAFSPCCCTWPSTSWRAQLCARRVSFG